MYNVIEIIIPLEIRKLGQEAVEIYMEALEEGKEKIPYCGLLILGEEQVGKTSLYRQLVGKEFKKDLDSTRGIDNNTVDTVDQRHVNTGKWKEEDEPASGEQFITALAGEVASKLPDDAPKDEKGEEMVKNEDLMKRIDEITQEITKMKEKSKTQSEQHQMKLVLEHLLSALPRESPPSKPPVPESLPPQPPKQPPPEKSPPPKKLKIHEERPQPPNKPPEDLENRTREIVLPKPIEDPPPPSLDESDPMEIAQTADPTPSDANPDESPHKQEAGQLDRKQATFFRDHIKNRRKFKKKEPSLVLNALDFAGQKEYRPMHHCFISRRALYVVVFKIPDVLDFINGKSKRNPLEEVCYWIHSIHAHIYPPEEDMKDVDEKINRVFLVGTHRGDPPRPQNELEKIDDSIYETLIKKKKEGVNPCTNHIHPFGETNSTKYFLAVENSIDIKKDKKNYRSNSGTEFLQNQIKEKSKMMPTLNDHHPIKWLKFEQRLKKYQESRKPAPVMKIEEARELAAKSRINAEDKQDLALRFFHDTGKIICLSKMVIFSYVL